MEKDYEKLFKDSADEVAEKLSKLESQKMTLPSDEEITLQSISDAISRKLAEIEKPRDRNPYETDEEYENYIKAYYEDQVKARNEKQGIEQEHLNEKFKNTPFYKPRYRKPYETEEEYQQFLDEYYEKTIDRKLDEKIEGSEVFKPRNRKPHETDEEYVEFLKKYYQENLIHIPKMALERETKHKVISTKQNLRYKLMKKFVIIATWVTIGLSALVNIKNITDKSHKADINKDNNKNVEHIDETKEIQEDIKKVAQDEIDRMLNQKKIKVGEKVRLKDGTIFYYDSTKSKPVGHIGNKYTSSSDKYIITGEAIIEKSTNSIVATNYDKNESLDDTFLHGKDRSKYRRMVLISSTKSNGKAGTENDYGWINAKNQNITTIQSHSNIEKSGRGK